jgi:hypothetical protein
VDETVSGAVTETQPGTLDPLRLKYPGIGGNGKRRCQQCRSDKFAPAELHRPSNTVGAHCLRGNGNPYLGRFSCRTTCPTPGNQLFAHHALRDTLHDGKDPAIFNFQF